MKLFKIFRSNVGTKEIQTCKRPSHKKRFNFRGPAFLTSSRLPNHQQQYVLRQRRLQEYFEIFEILLSQQIVFVSGYWIFLFEWKWVFFYFEIPDLFGKLNFESRKNLVDPRKERCSLIHRKRLSKIQCNVEIQNLPLKQSVLDT